jgi:hypothetical protein
MPGSRDAHSLRRSDAFPGAGDVHPEIAYRLMFIYVACVGFLGVGIYARFSRRGRRPHR